MQSKRINLFISFCVACAGLLTSYPGTDAAAPPPSRRSLFWRPEFLTPRGYIARGELYAIKTRVDPDDDYVNLHIHISKAPITPKPSAKNSVVRYKRWDSPRNYQMHGPLRWRIHGGVYWEDASGANAHITSFSRVFLDDLKYFDPAKNLEIDTQDEATTNRVHFSSWYLEPLDTLILAVTSAEAKRRGQEGLINTIAVEGIDYDLLPVGEKEGLLFVLHQKRMRLWRGVYTGENSQPDGRNVKWTEAKADSFAAPLDEPFQVYGDRENWQFLTSSGSLYTSRKPEKGPRKLNLLYASREKPLRAILTDSGTNKTFAFVAAPKSRTGEYFELSAGTKVAKPYTLPDAKLDAALDELLRSLMSYARVLLADKKTEGKLPVKAGEKGRAKP